MSSRSFATGICASKAWSRPAAALASGSRGAAGLERQAAARLLREDRQRGVVLLEWIEPGTPASNISDDIERTRVVARLVPHLWLASGSAGGRGELPFVDAGWRPSGTMPPPSSCQQAF